jgi:5'-3' exonuclease
MKDLYKKLLNEVTEEHQQQGTLGKNSNVLLVDGLNTFIRSWTANPSLNDNGEHIGGIVGSLKGIAYAIRQYNCTRCIVIFDGKGGSQRRKELFGEYKADRGNNRFRVNRTYEDMMTQEDEQQSMKRQLVSLVSILEHMPVQVMLYDRIEADDVIGYVASQLLKEDEGCTIMSSDKDFLQLVTDNVKVYSPTKKKLYTIDSVLEEYGVHPHNFINFRMLDGDKSDGINGIKGCGIKTIIKKIPMVAESTRYSVDDILSFVKQNAGNGKIYDDINDNTEIVERNYKLMQLSDPDISGQVKLKINDKFLESLKKFDKLDVIKAMMHYKVINSFGDVNKWLIESFYTINKLN